MPISLDSALGNLPEALQLRARRTETLASNLANADTPNYKARDFDFRAALAKADSGHLALTSTRSGHIQAHDHVHGNARMQYRVPDQPSLDGNTVDTQTERSAFTENAVRYQSTLTFLSGRFKGLMTALKGE